MSQLQRLLVLVNLLGFTAMLFAFLMLIPAGVSLYLGESTFPAFRDAFLGTLLAGGAVFLASRTRQPLRWPDGFLLVALTWLVLPLVASVPIWLYFNRAGIPITFTHAYFEAASGLTTTGSSVLNHLQSLPTTIHVWRATLTWIGGLGVLVLTVAVLPHLGVGGSQVMRAETPGPMKDEKLTPRIASTAKGMYAIYLGLSAACALAYYLAGMRGTDVFVHMAATVSLGGFSTRDQGLAAFNSPAIEWVAMVFMLISGISFATHFNAIRYRSLGPYRRCAETPYFLAISLGLGVFVSAWLYHRGIYATPEEALRYGMFNTISVVTTTGFANTNYDAWPVFIPLLLLIFSCFTVSSASPGSGLKLIRMVLLLKHARLELLRVVHPRVVAPLRLGARLIDARVMQGILAFLFLYLTTLAIASLLLMGSGLEPMTAFTAALACLNNLGPGLGEVGPAGSYHLFTTFQTWVCTAMMLLGRLELVTVLVLFTPTFWRR